MLNQIVRPFTAEWHRRSLVGHFDSVEACTEFRAELEKLRAKLHHYMGMLAEMAGVENLTKLESGNESQEGEAHAQG